MKPLPVRALKEAARQAPEPPPDRLASRMDRPRAPSFFRRKRALAGVGLVLVAAIASLAFLTRSLRASTTVNASRLSIEAAAVGSFQEFIPAAAFVVPAETRLLSTVRGGRVEEIRIEDGETVRAGAVLIKLSNIDLELQVMAHEAQLSEQLSNLARAQTALNQTMNGYERDLVRLEQEIAIAQDRMDRRRPLAGDGVSMESIRQLDLELNGLKSVRQLISEGAEREQQDGERNLRRLRQSVDRLSSGVELMRATLADLAVKAPIDGQATLNDLEIGQVAAPGAPLGQIDASEGYKLRARLDEYYLGQVFRGQTATAGAGEAQYALTVSKVYPTVTDRMFEVDLDFVDVAPPALRRGQSLSLKLHASANETVLSVPNGPFYNATAGEWAFVLSADGATAQRRPVSFGRRNAERVEVIAGLAPGERIVTSTYDDFETVQTLRLMNN
ncbi:MAG: HlyD family efflux transporter periplasmic adaptor subunit [Pseudomonadota bacterium]